MDRGEFLRRLENGLAGVSAEERVAAMQYYTEYLDEAGPEHEAEVLAELGDAEKIAAGIAAQSAEEEGGWQAPPRPLPALREQPAAPEGEQGAPAPQAPPQPPPADAGQGPAAAAAPSQSDRTARLILGILVLVLLSPLWGGLLGALVGVLASILVVFICPLIIGVALLATGALSAVSGILLFASSFADGLLMLGLAIVVVGLGLLSGYGGVMLLGKVLPKICVAIFHGIKALCKKLFGR